MSRVFVLSPEPIRDRMAGMGIRAAEIARHLSLADHPVTLATPGPADAAPVWLREAGVRVVECDPSRIGALAAGHDAAVVSGHAANDFFHGAEPIPTLVDLYDPFLVENLAYAPKLGWDPFRNDYATLRLQLSRGDRFLVSSPAQKAFYAGFLLALGRINPALHAVDPALDRLLPIVPFGTPAEPAERGEPRLRGVVPGIGGDDPILFFGGIYDWYDPEELLSAFSLVLAGIPDCRLVFVGNPNPETTPQDAFGRAERFSREKGWTGKNVFFVPWFPYDLRGSVYLEATAAVLTHRPGLETDLSLRTRGLDFLWAGLPIVSHRGGAMGSILAEAGAGLLVDVGDRSGLAGALVRILGEESLRRNLANRGRELASRFRWKQVLAPVIEFAANPAFDPLREAFAVADPLGELGAGGVSPVGPAEGASFSERLTTRLERILRGR